MKTRSNFEVQTWKASLWTRGSLRYFHLHHENWFVQPTCHVFLSSFVYSGLDFFMRNSADFSRKGEKAYPNGAPGPCSRFLVESELLIHFCYFVCIILFTLCSFLRSSVFHVWSLSLDYILLISARILVPLIALSSDLIGCNLGKEMIYKFMNRALMHSALTIVK